MRFVGLILTVLLSSAVHADCQTAEGGRHYVDLNWEAPNQFVGGKSLDASIDISEYQIWSVKSANNQSVSDPVKLKLLATATRNLRTCRILVNRPGEYDLAMVAVGTDYPSHLSKPMRKLSKPLP